VVGVVVGGGGGGGGWVFGGGGGAGGGGGGAVAAGQAAKLSPRSATQITPTRDGTRLIIAPAVLLAMTEMVL